MKHECDGQFAFHIFTFLLHKCKVWSDTGDREKVTIKISILLHLKEMSQEAAHYTNCVQIRSDGGAR